MKKLVEKVEDFIISNKLEFNDRDSGLNGNCVTLAGFICYVLDEEPDFNSNADGHDIIDELDFSVDANEELRRVFDYAYANCYEKFWKIPAAKEQYVF